MWLWHKCDVRATAKDAISIDVGNFNKEVDDTLICLLATSIADKNELSIIIDANLEELPILSCELSKPRIDS